MKFVAFAIAMVLFINGMVLMGYAFEPDSPHLIMFACGIASFTLAVIIPIHVMKRINP